MFGLLAKAALQVGAQAIKSKVKDFAHDKLKDQIREAIARGELVQVWKTAGDGKVCPICRRLDGGIIPKNGPWPPAHPRCRCRVEIEVQ